MWLLVTPAITPALSFFITPAFYSSPYSSLLASAISSIFQDQLEVFVLVFELVFEFMLLKHRSCVYSGRGTITLKSKLQLAPCIAASRNRGNAGAAQHARCFRRQLERCHAGWLEAEARSSPCPNDGWQPSRWSCAVETVTGWAPFWRRKLQRWWPDAQWRRLYQQRPKVGKHRLRRHHGTEAWRQSAATGDECGVRVGGVHPDPWLARQAHCQDRGPTAPD